MAKTDEARRRIVCSDCDTELEGPSTEETKPGSCPNCGSRKRTVVMVFVDRLSLHDDLAAKLRRGPGKKGILKEFLTGDAYSKTLDDWVQRIRLIDHQNNRYLETVKDKKTGEVIHYCDEPLSEHRGHGSAKFKKPDPT